MTKEEKRKQQIEELKKQLEEGVAAVYDSEEWKKYLAFAAKFYHYSWRNCLLIKAQNPAASRVAGYRAWQKNFKRQVKKGEKAIHILAPCVCTVKEEDKDGNETERTFTKGFRTAYVFDISQTDGEPVPEFCRELNTEDGKEVIGTVRSALISISPAAEIKMLSAEECHGSKGYYNLDDNIIAIKNDMPTDQTIKTMIHETAHSILHRYGGKEEKTETTAAELQAESIAFIVCKFLGVNTEEYSFPYVASWAKDKDGKQLAENLEIIGKTAKNMIDALESLTVKMKQPEYIEEK